VDLSGESVLRSFNEDDEELEGGLVVIVKNERRI
jgi:hypothetical protein